MAAAVALTVRAPKAPRRAALGRTAAARPHGAGDPGPSAGGAGPHGDTDGPHGASTPGPPASGPEPHGASPLSLHPFSDHPCTSPGPLPLR